MEIQQKTKIKTRNKFKAGNETCISDLPNDILNIILIESWTDDQYIELFKTCKRWHILCHTLTFWKGIYTKKNWKYQHLLDPDFECITPPILTPTTSVANFDIESKAPNVKAPNTKAPNVKAPNTKAPNVKAPNTKRKNKSKASKPPEMDVSEEDVLSQVESITNKSISNQPVSDQSVVKKYDLVEKLKFVYLIRIHHRRCDFNEVSSFLSMINKKFAAPNSTGPIVTYKKTTFSIDGIPQEKFIYLNGVLISNPGGEGEYISIRKPEGFHLEIPIPDGSLYDDYHHIDCDYGRYIILDFMNTISKHTDYNSQSTQFSDFFKFIMPHSKVLEYTGERDFSNFVTFNYTIISLEKKEVVKIFVSLHTSICLIGGDYLFIEADQSNSSNNEGNNKNDNGLNAVSDDELSSDSSSSDKCCDKKATHITIDKISSDDEDDDEYEPNFDNESSTDSSSSDDHCDKRKYKNIQLPDIHFNIWDLKEGKLCKTVTIPNHTHSSVSRYFVNETGEYIIQIRPSSENVNNTKRDISEIYVLLWKTGQIIKHQIPGICLSCNYGLGLYKYGYTLYLYDLISGDLICTSITTSIDNLGFKIYNRNHFGYLHKDINIRY